MKIEIYRNGKLKIEREIEKRKDENRERYRKEKDENRERYKNGKINIERRKMKIEIDGKIQKEINR